MRLGRTKGYQPPAAQRLEPSGDTGELTLELPRSAVPADLVQEDEQIRQLMATLDLCAVAEAESQSRLSRS